ncbi:MAG: SDR family oxidoreductase [Panacibacter sp.]
MRSLNNNVQKTYLQFHIYTYKKLYTPCVRDSPRKIRCYLWVINLKYIRGNPQMKERLAGLSPLNRVGSADDIGSVITFLCTEEARWINGQRIEVSVGTNV